MFKSINRYINLKNFEKFKNELIKFDLKNYKKLNIDYQTSYNNINEINYKDNLIKELKNDESELCNEFLIYIKSLSNTELDYFLFLLDIKGLEKYHPSIIFSNNLNNNLEANPLDSYYNQETELNKNWEKINVQNMSLSNASSSNQTQEKEKIEEVVEEKKIFDIKLISFKSDKKLSIIKEIKNIFGLGLKESKEMVEKIPCVLKKSVLKDDAEKIKEKLIGISCEINLV